MVPLNDHALSAPREQREWVGKYCAGSPWFFASGAGQRIVGLQKGFRAVCERVGIDDFRIHDLRHTFASWLVVAGVSLYVVKDLLGRSSISVTERYAHLSSDRGRMAVQGLLTFGSFEGR